MIRNALSWATLTLAIVAVPAYLMVAWMTTTPR